MDKETEQRVAQALKDGKALLEYWTRTVASCPDCGKLKEETVPYLRGLGVLLKDLGG